MLPQKYINKMKDLLKDEYALYEDSFNEPSIHSLRINTNKIKVEDFLKIFPYKLEKIAWTDDGFYFFDEAIYKHPFYYMGLYYIQEASAMTPAQFLPIDKGDIVLDACAAPGGKSLKLLNKLDNTGLLLSNDISISRCQALLRNIERQGFNNYYVSSCDLNDLAKKYPNTFDKILLDAPCSGEGMFRKEPSLIKSWLLKDSDYYSPIQKELIVSALSCLKEGGQLLYSTCTFDLKEDEEIIKYALSLDSSLRLIDLPLYPGFKKGIDDIGTKLFPHLIKGEGHFVCLIQKGDKKDNNNQIINRPYISPFTENLILNNGSLINIKDSLYYAYDFDIKGLRILRSGLYLGDNTKYGFEPSQALAMALNNKSYSNIYNLDIDDIRVIKYLKGETISIDTDLDGYILLCVNNLPLGFIKKQNNIIKNKIDKGWILR